MAASTSRTKPLAYSAAFAALYTVFRIVPISQLIGSSGFVPLSNALALTYALVLGPIAGSLSVILGTVIAYFMGNTPIFLGLDFITPLTAVLAMSLMVRRKYLWPLVAVFSVLLVLFNLSPMTLSMIPIPGLGVSFPLTWLHFVALGILIVYAAASGTHPSPSSSLTRLSLVSWAVAFVGLLLQQLVGSFVMYEGILGLYEGSISSSDWPGIWNAMFVLYPFEWISLTIASVLIAVPVYRLVSKRFALVEG
jgi:hypothetical protein